MTRPRIPMLISDGTGGLEPIPEWPKAREHYKFLGREQHYGFTYLIWILAKNPRAPHILGQRWVRVVT